MSEKKCDFCGEPLADWAQEHAMIDCAYYLKAAVAELEAENERLREYIIEEVGIEHVPEEFGGEA